MPRKLTPRRPATPPSFEARARALVARADLIPDVTTLIDRDEEAALVEAYIAQHVDADSQQAMRQAFVAREAPDTPDQPDYVWILQEIAYALGIEVGRRLPGGAR